MYIYIKDNFTNPPEKNPGHLDRLSDSPTKLPTFTVYVYLPWRIHGTFVYLPTPPKTNMTMENPPFEDEFPIEHGDFPMSC